MAYTIRIKRQGSKDEKPYWQEFLFDNEGGASVAAVLNELNARNPLIDLHGEETDKISWECGCMVRKCGACAMRINGAPRLACSTFLSTLKGKTIVLEPLRKFPLVRDLVVDRTAVFEKIKQMHVWLESEAYMASNTHEARYQSARCMMCGCCLEVCPNFSIENTPAKNNSANKHHSKNNVTKNEFIGAIAPVNLYRILKEEQDNAHKKEMIEAYKKHYFEGCGKSLSCHSICPANIPVEELMVQSNAAAIWKR